MLRVRVTDDVLRLALWRLKLPPRLYETEELLVEMRRLVPHLTYSRLYRFLERLAEQGIVEKMKVRIVYVDPVTQRKFTVTRTMWRVR